jgi:predicted nucleotidyltransferase
VREILQKNDRDPLFSFTRAEAIEHIKSSLRGRVHEAYLYRSFARGDMDPDSDIDCMVVADTGVPFPMQGRLFDDLRDRLPSLEVLVYTRKEFQSLTTEPSPGFWRSVTKDLVRIL